MKRVISIALAVLMVAALLAACGGSSSPEGKYVVKTVDGKTVSQMIEEYGMTVDEFTSAAGISSPEELLVLEIKSDGTVTVTEAIFGSTSNGTWTQDGDKISMTINDETNSFTVSGSDLKISMDGQEYVMTKK